MLTLVLALLQQQLAPPPPARLATVVSRVEVSPNVGEVPVGGTLQLSARAIGTDGRPVANATIRFHGDGEEGTVSPEGIVRGNWIGRIRVTAVASVPGARPGIGQAQVTIVPAAPARIDVTPAPSRLLAGTRLTLAGRATSAHGDASPVPVTFRSSNARVVQVEPDGRLTAVAPGSATITAAAGPARAELAVQVLPAAGARLALAPAAAATSSAAATATGPVRSGASAESPSATKPPDANNT